jgi:hypothetical protein
MIDTDTDNSQDLDLNPMLPYTILEVNPDDTLKSIKNKFTKEILKYHPDKFGDRITEKERNALEKHCRRLIRSYKIIKRNKESSSSFSDMKNVDRSKIEVSTNIKQKEKLVDKSNRFKSIDDYLDFNLPKPQRRSMDIRDFNEEFEKKKKAIDTGKSKALVLRTADGFTGYNIEQFQKFAKNVSGDDLINQTEIVWKN